jgi:hypothetical protein
MAQLDSDDDLLLDRWHYYYAIAGQEISYPSLDRRIHTRYYSEEGASHERRLRELGTERGGLPHWRLAFRIGQCLWPLLTWSSGPIALWAAGRTFDFVGFFASLLSLRPPTMKDFQRVANVTRAFTPTIFDAAPFLDDTYVTAHAEMDDEELAYFRRCMRPIVPEIDEIIERDRQNAWRFWEVTEKELKEFDDAWTYWGNIRNSPAAWHELHEAFRAALSLAKAPALMLSERERIAEGHLVNGVLLLLQLPGSNVKRQMSTDEPLQSRLTRYSRWRFKLPKQ